MAVYIVCHLLTWCLLVCVWELISQASMCAHSRHTFYYWQQSFNKASFYGGIQRKPPIITRHKAWSPFSMEWEWSSAIISWCRLARPSTRLWSLMKLRPLFLLLLTHATFASKIFPLRACETPCEALPQCHPPHTHHRGSELYTNSDVCTHRPSGIPSCLSQTGSKWSRKLWCLYCWCDQS